MSDWRCFPMAKVWPISLWCSVSIAAHNPRLYQSAYSSHGFQVSLSVLAGLSSIDLQIYLSLTHSLTLTLSSSKLSQLTDEYVKCIYTSTNISWTGLPHPCHVSVLVDPPQSLTHLHLRTLLNPPMPPAPNLSLPILLSQRRLKHQHNRTSQLKAPHLLAPPQRMTL